MIPPCFPETDTRRVLRIPEINGGVPLKKVATNKSPNFYKGQHNFLPGAGGRLHCNKMTALHMCSGVGGSEVPDSVMQQGLEGNIRRAHKGMGWRVKVVLCCIIYLSKDLFCEANVSL